MAKRRLVLFLSAIFFAGGVHNYCLAAADASYYKNPPIKVSAVAGRSIVLKLESNKTAGYEWQLAEPVDETMLHLEKTEYLPHETRLIGAGGIEKWTFTALKEGKTVIFLKYVRPWESNVPPAQIRTFLITIEKEPR